MLVLCMQNCRLRTDKLATVSLIYSAEYEQIDEMRQLKKTFFQNFYRFRSREEIISYAIG